MLRLRVWSTRKVGEAVDTCPYPTRQGYMGRKAQKVLSPLETLHLIFVYMGLFPQAL